MSDKSAKVAVKILYKHYALNEKTLFREHRPHMIKSTRTVANLKRGIKGEIMRILPAYDDDELMIIEDCPYVKELVPGKNYTAEEKAMGLTKPRPDLTYGIQKPEFPPTIEAKLKMKCQTWRSVASGMDWPFFVIEYKGYEDSIAQTKNQAIRDEAVLINDMYSSVLFFPAFFRRSLKEEASNSGRSPARKKLNEELQPADYVRPTGADENIFVFFYPW